MGRETAIKETLTTLRVLLVVVITAIIAITGGLINLHYANKIDFIFYTGAVLVFILMLVSMIFLKTIIKKQKEIGTL